MKNKITLEEVMGTQPTTVYTEDDSWKSVKEDMGEMLTDDEKEMFE